MRPLSSLSFLSLNPRIQNLTGNKNVKGKILSPVGNSRTVSKEYILCSFQQLNKDIFNLKK